MSFYVTVLLIEILRNLVNFNLYDYVILLYLLGQVFKYRFRCTASLEITVKFTNPVPIKHLIECSLRSSWNIVQS